MKLRVKFSKKGVLKYIGHLDLMRYFQKAFRRTDIRVKYSTGFSPHMIMSFAQALGVGVESEGEYFDVEIEEGQDTASVVDKLNAQMAEGIEVISVTVLSDKAGNAMSSVAASDFEIDFYEGNPLTEEIISEFKSMDSVMYTKTTKKGETELNLKDFVFDIKYLDKGVFFRVDSSSSGSLKPKFLLEALLKLADKNLDDYPYHVLRKELYLRKSDGTLAPLSDYEE